MYFKYKKQDINCIDLKDGYNFRYDYGKTKLDFSTLIRGEEEKVKDCR